MSVITETASTRTSHAGIIASASQDQKCGVHYKIVLYLDPHIQDPVLLSVFENCIFCV